MTASKRIFVLTCLALHVWVGLVGCGVSMYRSSRFDDMLPRPLQIKNQKVGDNLQLSCDLRTFGLRSEVAAPKVTWSWTQDRFTFDYLTLVEHELVNVQELDNDHTSMDAIRPGGEDLSDGATAKMLNGNWTLNIDKLTKQDAGWYTCQVYDDEEGKEKYQEFLVKVKEKRDTDERDRVQYIIEKAGGNITLDCEVDVGKTPIWTKTGGSTLKESGVKLNLFRIDKEDEGEYLCMVDGSLAKNVTIRVNHPPTIRVEKTVVEQVEGQSVSLDCIVSSIPVSAVKWFKMPDPSKNTRMERHRSMVAGDMNNIHVRHQLKLMKTGDGSQQLEKIGDGYGIYSLYFPHVGSEDFGVYSCNATNTLGQDSKLITLKKAERPQNKEANGGSSLCLRPGLFSNLLLTSIVLLLHTTFSPKDFGHD